MSSQVALSCGSLVVVLVLMLAESWLSRRNEAWLRLHGAVEPPGDVYRTMQWVYPAAFVVMAAEGAYFGPAAPGWIAAVGALLLAAAKALKYWAVASLGRRWTFRVLVLPGVPLVSTGPYALLRHPNYLAVVGELAGMALLVGAMLSGPVMTGWFGWLMWRRIIVENQVVRHPPCT